MIKNDLGMTPSDLEFRRSRQKKEKLGYSRGSSANSDIIKTEEGDKSTTYIIPAATDSTVKVLD